MKKLLFVITVLILSTTDIHSQCSMLSAIMESDQEYEAAKGLNRGIVYLMSIPYIFCLLYTSPSPRDRTRSRMPSSA